jgi:hypothetical protein
VNYLRIVFFGAFLSASVFFGWDMLEQAFGEQREVYVIDGILNYWAVFGGFLVSLIIIVYCLAEILKRNLSAKFLNVSAIISCVIISPIISIALREAVFHRANDYVKCERLSKLSSRYSSQTYAVNNEVCVKLEEMKKPLK